MENICQREKNDFTFMIKLLVLKKFRRWRGKSITVTERMKLQSQCRTKNLQGKPTRTSSAIRVLRKESKRFLVNGRKCINQFKSTLMGEIWGCVARIMKGKDCTKSWQVMKTFYTWQSDSVITFIGVWVPLDYLGGMMTFMPPKNYTIPICLIWVSFVKIPKQKFESQLTAINPCSVLR